MLRRNLKYLRKQKRASQEQIANEIGISRSALADYENGRSEPAASVLIKLSEHFETSVDDLLNKDIDIPLFRTSFSEIKSLQNRDVRVVAITVQENQRQNVEFIPIPAIAGYAQNFDNPEFISELPHFSIPKLSQGTYRAFEVNGNSMPPIHNGFVVIGEYVEHYSNLKNGKRYVLILKENGVVFKKIINEIDDNRRLILVSDNAEHSPYTVKITDVLEAWEMVAFIGYPNKMDMNYILLDKLHEIQQQIALLSSEKS